MKYIINLFQRHWVKILFALVCFFASFLHAIPSFVIELLRVFTGLFLGLIIDQEYQSETVEHNREKERISVIEQVNELKLLGLKRILPARDSAQEGSNFNFFERMKLHKPKHNLTLIGLTHGALVNDHFRPKLIDFLKNNPKLKLSICFLNPESPCALLRSNEVHRDKDEKEREQVTPINIEASIKKWKSVSENFPNRISIKKYNSIPYAEYEVIDKDDKNGNIYFIPISYTKHTNDCPSFILEGKSTLYTFHKEIIETIWRDADPI